MSIRILDRPVQKPIGNDTNKVFVRLATYPRYNTWHFARHGMTVITWRGKVGQRWSGQSWKGQFYCKFSGRGHGKNLGNGMTGQGKFLYDFYNARYNTWHILHVMYARHQAWQGRSVKRWGRTVLEMNLPLQYWSDLKNGLEPRYLINVAVRLSTDFEIQYMTLLTSCVPSSCALKVLRPSWSYLSWKWFYWSFRPQKRLESDTNSSFCTTSTTRDTIHDILTSCMTYITWRQPC